MYLKRLMKILDPKFTYLFCLFVCLFLLKCESCFRIQDGFNTELVMDVIVQGSSTKSLWYQDPNMIKVKRKPMTLKNNYCLQSDSACITQRLQIVGDNEWTCTDTSRRKTAWRSRERKWIIIKCFLWTKLIKILLLFFSSFGSLCAALVIPELAMKNRLALNSWLSTCLCLQSVGGKGMPHHTQSVQEMFKYYTLQISLHSPKSFKFLMWFFIQCEYPLLKNKATFGQVIPQKGLRFCFLFCLDKRQTKWLVKLVIRQQVVS